MGNIWPSLSSEKIKKSRKRSATNAAFADDHPVKKRIRSTYDYIYKELYRKGEGSDLTVRCLDRDWHLHRLYVRQSPFFSAMLDGNWKESVSDAIDLEISDFNVTVSALDIVFGSFYRDTVLLSESTVLAVLAAATWFHLDDIRLLCSEFMARGLSKENTVERYELAKEYNLPDLQKQSVQWVADSLLLMSDSADTHRFLCKIPVDLMHKVIEKPDLVVVQLEQDVLLLLLKWVYLRSHPDCKVSSPSQLLEDAYAYFTASASENCSFLESPEGAVYAPAFRAIRWEHVLNVNKTTQRMVRDKIIPEAWLCSIFSRQWLRLLYTHDQQTTYGRHTTSSIPESFNSSLRGVRTTLTARQSYNVADSPSSTQLTSPSALEPGPLSCLSDEVFWATSERCGRRMMSGDATCSWRWTGYHFGLDVVVKYKRRTFSIIRFTEYTSAEGAVSHAPHVRLLIALRVRSLAEPVSSSATNTALSASQVDPVDAVTLGTEQVDLKDSGTTVSSSSTLVATTGVLAFSLEENVVQDVLRLPDCFTFPAVISANILRYEPIGWDVSYPASVSTTSLSASNATLCSLGTVSDEAS